MYYITRQIMNKDIPATYTDTGNYWCKYPELYEGAFPIRNEILEHEVNKYSLCDNTLAREKYGWVPLVDMKQGLKNVVEYIVQLLSTKVGTNR